MLRKVYYVQGKAVNTVNISDEQAVTAFRPINAFAGENVVPGEKVVVRFFQGDEHENYFFILHPEDLYTMLSIAANAQSSFEWGGAFLESMGVLV